jgi:serine/threonine protein kinase
MIGQLSRQSIQSRSILCNVLGRLKLRARMALTSGTKLGPYEIQTPLGASGMGEVYRARDTRLDRSVAIKILPAAFSSDADRLQRFQQEARFLSSLNHNNLLAIFDVGNQNGSYYLVRVERLPMRAKYFDRSLIRSSALE